MRSGLVGLDVQLWKSGYHGYGHGGGKVGDVYVGGGDDDGSVFWV